MAVLMRLYMVFGLLLHGGTAQTTPAPVVGEVDACEAHPCQNGGTCTDVAGGAHDASGRSCACLAGWGGDSCETECCHDLHVDCLTCQLNISRDGYCNAAPSTPGCFTESQPVIEWLAATEDNQNCSETCVKVGRRCFPPYFKRMSNDAFDDNGVISQEAREVFEEIGVACTVYKRGKKQDEGPAYERESGECKTRHPQNRRNKCNGRQEGMIRVCPCTLIRS